MHTCDIKTIGRKLGASAIIILVDMGITNIIKTYLPIGQGYFETLTVAQMIGYISAMLLCCICILFVGTIISIVLGVEDSATVDALVFCFAFKVIVMFLESMVYKYFGKDALYCTAGIVVLTFGILKYFDIERKQVVVSAICKKIDVGTINIKQELPNGELKDCDIGELDEITKALQEDLLHCKYQLRTFLMAALFLAIITLAYLIP